MEPNTTLWISRPYLCGIYELGKQEGLGNTCPLFTSISARVSSRDQFLALFAVLAVFVNFIYDDCITDRRVTDRIAQHFKLTRERSRKCLT